MGDADKSSAILAPWGSRRPWPCSCGAWGGPKRKEGSWRRHATSSDRRKLTDCETVNHRYTTNIGVILLNKYLLSVYGFRFPILLTLFHMVSCTLCSASVVLFGVVPLQKLKSTKHTIKVATLAFVFCCSIVAGNVSLRFIPVSFSQAIGATTPIFTAIFAAMFGRIESGRTYLALIPIVIGIVLASRAEPNFHVVGFSAAVVATAGRAFKSVLQSLLLTSNDEQLDSMNLLMYMSPIAALMLLPATVVMEEGALSQVMELGSNNPSFVLLLLLNALFAFLVNLYNFLVTRYTSALTLQVLGNAKGVLATFISVLIFKNKITVIGLLGYGIAIAGVVLYSNEKKRTGKERTHTLEKVRVGHS